MDYLDPKSGSILRLPDHRFRTTHIYWPSHQIEATWDSRSYNDKYIKIYVYISWAYVLKEFSLWVVVTKRLIRKVLLDIIRHARSYRSYETVIY